MIRRMSSLAAVQNWKRKTLSLLLKKGQKCNSEAGHDEDDDADEDFAPPVNSP